MRDMRNDGLCDTDCGSPAIVEIAIGGESGYFCAQCAPTGKASPVAAVAEAPYAKPCPCGGTLAWLGEDQDGRDVWQCAQCDHRE
jgi:hypothetical protein